MTKAIHVVLVLCAACTSFFSAPTSVFADGAPQLISAVLEGPVLTDRIQKTAMNFTRASAAYMPDGQEVSEAVPRFRNLAIFNRPEHTVAGPYSRKNVLVLAHCNGYFWGAQLWNYADNNLYRSSDANNWEAVAKLDRGTVSSLYVTEAGLLLVGTRFPGGVCIWDAGTGRLVRTLTMLSEDPFPKHWSWAEMNGVIYVGEYGYKYGSNNARRIYQSRDGGWNWEVLYDPSPADGYHVHKVLADPYRSHLYWSHGDNYSELFRSLDGGETWQILSSVEQPTAGIARPEGVYFGADNFNIGIYRFLNGSKEAEYVCTDLVEGYIWDMREFNGVIYATSLYHHYDPNIVVYPTVLISADGKHWGNLYQLQPELSGLERFACAVDATIYAVMEADLYEAANVSFPQPTVRTGWGIFVEPTIENLLASPCDGSFEECDKVSWQAHGPALIEVSSDRAHSGTKSLKVSNPSTNAMGAISPAVNGEFPAGTVVGATVRVSGWNNIRWLYAQIVDTTNRLSSPRKYVRSGVGWLEICIYWQLPRDSTALSVEVGSTSSATPGDILYVDSVTIAANCVPVSFQMGGHPVKGGRSALAGPDRQRAAEVLCHSLSFPDRWTDVFCWLSPYIRGVPIDSPKVIKSWASVYGQSWLQLVLDQAGSFKLEEVNPASAGAESLVSLAAPDFLPGSLIWFATVRDVNQTRLHILCPQGWLGANGRGTNIAPNRIFFGSTPQGTQQAGGLYSNARVYDDSMTANQIARVIDEIAGRSFTLGDLDYDGRVGLSDLAVLAQRWLNDCDNIDWCGHTDLNMNGTVDLVDFAHFAAAWQNFPQ